MTDKYLTSAEVRDLLQVNASTLWRWCKSEKSGFPRPFKIGPQSKRWSQAELTAFLEAKRGA